jgi:hypothetical protein
VGAIALTVRHGLSQVGMTAHTSPSELAAMFQVNGLPFATAAGNPANPELRSADGRVLTAAELEALRGIHRLAGEVLRMFADLMQLVGGVLAPVSGAADVLTEPVAAGAVR